MTTLYHGSTLKIEQPLANAGRADLDFGQGFYLTSLRSQAEQWAMRMQLIRAQETAWLNVYEFDKKAVFSDGYSSPYLSFLFFTVASALTLMTAAGWISSSPVEKVRNLGKDMMS